MNEARDQQRQEDDIDNRNQLRHLVDSDLRAETRERDVGSGRGNQRPGGEDRQPSDDDPSKPPEIFCRDVTHSGHRRASRFARATATNISRSVMGCASTEAPGNSDAICRCDCVAA